MVRFLADACLHDGIVSGCRRREPRIDFMSAHEARLEGVADFDVLALAARERPHCRHFRPHTMPRHFGDFLQAHGQCPGVFLVKQSARLVDVIEDLIMVWAASDADEWRNRIIEIPQ
jgi:hypothetical protein